MTHTGKPSYECTVCNKTYTSKGGLKYHERSHTGDRHFSLST
ncbi:hypothetical protein NP493_941g02042 [Ridgeia piscesae]|uniref:C2H2-type domain-containing protein n=1 Tax=Ridgeia piscesae TaxID=27915 RepID=A0AAD9KK19_RIDPI|nr:hypothetical protein NP493_941g02042 [Ridgeia piscesae]